MAISVDNVTQPVVPTATTATGGNNEAAAAAANRQTAAASTAPAAPVAQPEPSPEEFEVAVADLSEFIDLAARSLRINVDRDFGRPIVTVLDRETEEVVRQIPTEEVVRLSKYIRSQLSVAVEPPSADALTGILLNQQS